ncbi:hypothetical protein GCM10020331_014240 [Ectobacillus funiculus]
MRGVIGVGIGGDRTSGYELAKEQLFRSLDDEKSNSRTAPIRRIRDGKCE